VRGGSGGASARVGAACRKNVPFKREWSLEKTLKSLHASSLGTPAQGGWLSDFDLARPGCVPSCRAAGCSALLGACACSVSQHVASRSYAAAFLCGPPGSSVNGALTSRSRYRRSLQQRYRRHHRLRPSLHSPNRLPSTSYLAARSTESAKTTTGACWLCGGSMDAVRMHRWRPFSATWLSRCSPIIQRSPLRMTCRTSRARS
jgi:hypothetical protein